MYRVRQQLECIGKIAKEYQGESVNIAILDTGIFPHVDFDKRIIAFRDFVNYRNDVYDDSGHATHITGCMIGSGYVSEGRLAGIAPKAKIVVGKILDQFGDGCIDDMLKGIQWILDNREKFQIKVLNISIGIGIVENTEKKEMLIEKIEELWDSGIVVVVAAGNKGPAPMSISPLALSEKVIAVGCHDGRYFGKNEQLCQAYSGRGPLGYYIRKPDVVAPGTNIVSCSHLCHYTPRGYRMAYTAKSGTSMATPLVSGAAAMLIDSHHGITNNEIKNRILKTAVDMGESPSLQGWGMLNIRKLLE